VQQVGLVELVELAEFAVVSVELALDECWQL